MRAVIASLRCVVPFAAFAAVILGWKGAALRAQRTCCCGVCWRCLPSMVCLKAVAAAIDVRWVVVIAGDGLETRLASCALCSPVVAID